MLAQAPIVISNRYHVIAQLGTGGMGVVYRANDRLTGQTVAVKQVLVSTRKLRFSSKTDSADSTLLLAQEFKFLASLRHPHIISVLDYGFDGQGHSYYVMALLEGAQELAAVGFQCDLTGKITLLLQMLQALAYLHRQGILHRDLKPANVLVDAQDQVKVVDFGLAVGVNQDTAPGGTLAYMAPEVLRGHSAVVQSDLYAVGVITYELFAGQRPFKADNPVTLALMYEAIYAALDLEPLSMSPDLVLIVRRLLAPDIEDRYATAEEVMQAFAEVIGQPLLLETQATRESFLQAARFVGRDTELNLLNEALAHAAENQGSVWLIGGESGVGKSRLLEELQTQALLRGALVLRGQAVAEGGTPYQIWREAIRRLLLQTELTDYQASVLKPILPDIGRLLGREVADPPQVDAQSLQLRLWAVIEMIFTQQQLTVLLLEDLHWADESLILLNWLLELTKRSPLLIVGTYRDDERPSLPAECPGSQHIKLARLSIESIAQLSESMLGNAGKSSGVLRLLERETEGNVYFIVEVLRTLAEVAGGLANVGRDTLPAHVFAGGMQTVIKRRLDKTPESARKLLTIAAVGGREIDLKILHVILPTYNLDDWLQQVATVIEVQDNRYRFAHDKLRETILTALEAEERSLIHRDIAQAIETAYPDDPEQYATLTYHWGQAHDPAKTIHYATLAGQQALRSGSYREAVAFFENALALTDQVQLDKLQMSNLYYLIGDAHWGQSNLFKSCEAHTQALRLLGYSVPQSARQLALHTIKPLLGHIARRVFRRQAQADNPDALLIAARSFEEITQSSYIDANFALGLYSIFSGMGAAERAGNSPQAVRLQARYYSLLGFATGDISVHRLARAYFGLAQKRLQAESDPETLAYCGLPYSIYFAGRGQWEQANHLIQEAARLSQVAGSLRLWVQIKEIQLCNDYLHSRFADALDTIESAGQIAVRDGHTQSISRFQIAKARVLFLQGKTDEASAYYAANAPAIEAALSIGEQTVSKIMANGLLTEFYTRREEWDAALKTAETLNSLIKTAQTISFALLSEASASIELYLTLWERQGAQSHNQPYDQRVSTMLKLYHRKYARHYEIGYPVEYAYRCWYSWLSGNEKQARTMGALAIQAARTYTMPYYEATAHYHLGRFMAKDSLDRAEHLHTAAALFDQIGAAYNADCAWVALED